MSFLIRLLFLLGIIALIDVYAWQAFRTVFQDKIWVKTLYWGLNGLLYAGMLGSVIALAAGWQLPKAAGYWWFTFALVLFVPKLVIGAFMLLDDTGRVVRWVASLFGSPATGGAEGAIHISRSKFLSQTALALAALPFAHMLYGVLKGRYQFTLRRVDIPVPGLPEAFDGFTIAQISDIHVGSFDDKQSVQRGIDMVNAQGADLIVFTGDLINDHIRELRDYGTLFSQLKAPEGVYSVLGNHDYSDYMAWPSKEEKAAHLQQVIQAHADMGWRLLLNENTVLRRGDDSLVLAGVENWGKGGFSKYGKLDQALRGVETHPFKILLSHDPSHWDAEIKMKQPGIRLTLSGHTHGMQFGVEIKALGIKWSPVKWQYPQWAGLYSDPETKQHLYVNRGFGHIGFMGRAGIMPEVTVLRLKRA